MIVNVQSVQIKTGEGNERAANILTYQCFSHARALRFVYQDKISTYETLIVKNGYSTLANQRLAKILNTVFGAIGNGNVSKTISELLTARNSNYNLCGDAILK